MSLTDTVLMMALSASGLLILSLIAAGVNRGQVRWRWIVIAVLAVALHDVALTRFGHLLPPWPTLDADWNVSGKLYAIVAVLVMAALLRMPRSELGLVMGTGARARLGWIVCIGLVAALAGLALVMPGERAPWSTLAYQATLPGLAEELFYRGLLLALLMRAFAPAGDRAAVVTAAVMVTALFVQAHVLIAGDGRVEVHPAGGTTSLIVGTVLVWLRLRTGGLAAPVLLHNSVNTLFRLI